MISASVFIALSLASTYTLSLSLSLFLHTDQSSTDNIAAVVGGVVGGLIVL